MAKAMSEIIIDSTDINNSSVATTVTGDKLTGTVLENKQVFDRYPEMIAEHFNDLCDYINEQAPTGDAALSYTTTEISNICTALGCTESEITM